MEMSEDLKNTIKDISIELFLGTMFKKFFNPKNKLFKQVLDDGITEEEILKKLKGKIEWKLYVIEQERNRN